MQEPTGPQVSKEDLVYIARVLGLHVYKSWPVAQLRATVFARVRQLAQSS